MNDDTFKYIILQYEETARFIRYLIDCRYRILQFVDYFNAAVLTVGFSQKILLSETNTVAGLVICIVSFLVAVMGLATEFSTTSYTRGYFEYMRLIEDRLGADEPKGIITHGRNTITGNSFHKVLPVHRAHKVFYIVLMAFWTILFVYQARM